MSESPPALEFLDKRDIESYAYNVNDGTKQSTESGDEKEKPIKRCSKELTRIVLIAWAIASAVAMSTEGILCLSRVVCNTVNVRQHILSIYYLLFAVVVVVAELKRFGKWSKYIKLLQFRSGRACVYIFLGTVCLGEEIISKVIAANWVILAIANIVATCYCLDNRLAKEQRQSQMEALNSLDNVERGKEEDDDDVALVKRYQKNPNKEQQVVKELKYKVAVSDEKGRTTIVAEHR